MNPRFQIKAIHVLAIWMIAISSVTSGQTNPSNVNMIPNAAPVSPDVAKLTQFQNYPVNHFTGLANISIPIFEIQAGDITVPITLSYHTGGIKVTEHSGWVGLGWSLEPGGTISRSVMGMADELSAGYLSDTTIHSSISSTSATDLLYLNSIVRGNKDTEPDIYSYSFGDYSGKFAFNQKDDWSKVMIPYSPVKIEHEYSQNDLDFVAFDPYGIEYKFNSIHESSSGINDYVSVRSAWKISKIISADKQDTVQFSYSSSTGEIYKDISDRIVVDDQVDNPINYTYFSSSQGSSTVSNISVTGTEQKLTEILFPTGKLVFSLSARTDDGWSNTSNGTQKKLDSISIYQYIPASDSYVRIRLIYFDYGLFTSTDGTSTKRLKLDSLRICDGSGVLDQKYSFDYNTTYILPGYTSRKRDLWGYYNGRNNNTLVPRTTISFQSLITSTPTNITIGSSLSNGRDPNETYMKACILEKITYPTGGWTEFDYEVNEYLDGSTPTDAGGLRISEMTSYAESGSVAKQQTFKYGANESGYGRANFHSGNYWLVNEVTIHGFLDCGTHCPCEAFKRSRTYMSTPSISIEPYDGSAVVYSEVAVYDGDATTNNGKTVYNYSDVADQINMSFQTGNPAIESKHFKRGLLTSSESFSNATGTPTTARDSSTFGAFSDSTKYNIGLKVKKTLVMDDDSPLGTGDACDSDGDTNAYTWAYYDVLTGDNRPKTSISYAYSSEDDTDYVSTSTSYDYENYEHQQLTKTTVTNSDGVLHIKEIDYIQDVTSSAVHDSMIARHMLAYPVKETSKRGTTTLETITRSYHRPQTDVYAVEDITRQIGTGSAVTMVDFQEFDSRGNILQFEQRDGTLTSYVWGYDGTKAIAQAINAEDSEIFYTSFEENGTTSTTAATGNYIKSLSAAYSITKTIDAGSYLLTYQWRSSSSSPWELQVESKTHTSGSISTLKTSGQIDELRLYPVDAQMTTYTYDPLVGVSSITDPNNRSLHYEYDDFGRLIEVTDADGVQIQEVEYNYTNQ